MGYQGFDFINKVKNSFNKVIEVVKRPRKGFWVPDHVKDLKSYLKERGYEIESGFQVQKKRWVVERTFAWLGKFRRLSKDYEFSISSSESMSYLAMIKNMVKRIVNFKNQV